MSVQLVVDALSWVLVAAGSVFLVIGAIGLVRMPDVFTRMHATSVSDTAGAGLLMVGLMLQAGLSLVTVKLLFILLIFFFVGPVATHALARAALSVGLEPMCFDTRGRKRKHVPLNLAEARTAAAAQKEVEPAAAGAKATSKVDGAKAPARSSSSKSSAAKSASRKPAAAKSNSGGAPTSTDTPSLTAKSGGRRSGAKAAGTSSRASRRTSKPKGGRPSKS